MRLLSGLALAAIFALPLIGCTPYIPIKEGFATSALKPTGNIPPEFVDFNNFDPEVNPLVAEQICATPYILRTENSLRSAPGELIARLGHCEPYQIRIGNLAEHFSP